VEVSNNSKTDPCAWLGCVATVGKKCLVGVELLGIACSTISPGEV